MLAELRDRKGAAIIASRIARLVMGNFGDVEPIGKGLSELRIHYGPGYRVYLKKVGSVVIVILSGSDKDDQAKAIRAAKRAAKDLEP
jgi:putative addiction module killer protein